jgi:hypothetical protein
MRRWIVIFLTISSKLNTLFMTGIGRAECSCHIIRSDEIVMCRLEFLTHERLRRKYCKRVTWWPAWNLIVTMIPYKCQMLLSVIYRPHVAICNVNSKAPDAVKGIGEAQHCMIFASYSLLKMVFMYFRYYISASWGYLNHWRLQVSPLAKGVYDSLILLR